MRRLLLCLAFAYVAKARLIAVGFRDYGSNFADVQVQSLQLSDSNTDNTYTMYPQHFESSWANQQLDLLNTLQSFMLTPAMPRCGGHKRSQDLQMPPATNTMNPDVMSYLASSRLGSLPAAFDVFSQLDAAMDAAAADAQQSSTAEPSDLRVEDFVRSLVNNDAAFQLQTQPEDGQTEGSKLSEDAARSVMATAMSNDLPDVADAQTAAGAEVESEPWTAFDQLAVEQGDVDDSLNWGLVDAAGNVNWGFLIFGVLCLACGAVWLRLLHAWCALGRACLSCPRAERQAQFLTLTADDMHSPLLAPVQQDGPMGAIKSYNAKAVEVASEHVPEGVEYVSIAYVPLKGAE